MAAAVATAVPGVQWRFRVCGGSFGCAVAVVVVMMMMVVVVVVVVVLSASQEIPCVLLNPKFHYRAGALE
jgi:uncharacterized membrane protein